uniref:Uncharacterized protein n=1 Tax=Meloidogyne enterolobii TaxID=390850 RepID=A0A6V7WEP6_MELEN|nr:unnamed protein product [Meloidogyne enterolobii]
MFKLLLFVFFYSISINNASSFKYDNNDHLLQKIFKFLNIKENDNIIIPDWNTTKIVTTTEGLIIF